MKLRPAVVPLPRTRLARSRIVGGADGGEWRLAFVQDTHRSTRRRLAMLISSSMNDQINQQIGHEFGASFQYVNIAGYFDSVALPVVSRHFLRQADEEREHAMKFVRYVLDAGGTVAVPAIPAARAEFASAEEAVALALEWELTVTKQISALLDRASKERDYVAHDFLEWFAREQLEEVSSMETLLKMIQRAGEPGLLQVEAAIAAGRMRAAPERHEGGGE